MLNARKAYISAYGTLFWSKIPQCDGLVWLSQRGGSFPFPKKFGPKKWASKNDPPFLTVQRPIFQKCQNAIFDIFEKWAFVRSKTFFRAARWSKRPPCSTKWPVKNASAFLTVQKPIFKKFLFFQKWNFWKMDRSARLSIFAGLRTAKRPYQNTKQQIADTC